MQLDPIWLDPISPIYANVDSLHPARSDTTPALLQPNRTSNSINFNPEASTELVTAGGARSACGGACRGAWHEFQVDV